MTFGKGYAQWTFGGRGFGRPAAGERGEGRGRGRHGRRMFDGGELRLVLLKLIADQPRHGYDLIRAIEEMTGGSYAPSPGVVYPTLTMLQDMDLIEEAPSEGSRKLFAVTAEGRKELAGKSGEAEALIARLADFGARERRHGSSPVARAMANLGIAIGHRLAREDDSSDIVHDIAAIIDEAAQKIEKS